MQLPPGCSDLDELESRALECARIVLSFGCDPDARNEIIQTPLLTLATALAFPLIDPRRRFKSGRLDARTGRRGAAMAKVS